MQDQEKGHLQQLQSLMPTYRARPSLLGPLAAAAGFSLGAAAGVLPTKFAHAITGDAQTTSLQSQLRVPHTWHKEDARSLHLLFGSKSKLSYECCEKGAREGGVRVLGLSC